MPVECSAPPTTPATSPARPPAWTEGAFCTPDEASAESNAGIPSTTENSERERERERGLRSMKLLGLDHIGIVVRDINETIARAGDTVDGRALGERILAGDIDLQFLLCGETRLELIEVRAAGFGMPKLK